MAQSLPHANAQATLPEAHMRLTSHPGPFNKLASPKERVFQLTYKDLGTAICLT